MKLLAVSVRSHRKFSGKGMVYTLFKFPFQTSKFEKEPWVGICLTVYHNVTGWYLVNKIKSLTKCLKA